MKTDVKVPQFCVGNVVKMEGGSGNLVIISRVDAHVVHWVSFSFTNSSGISYKEDKEEDAICYECQESDYPDSECQMCGGKMSYKNIRRGFNHSTILAANVESYITSRLLKNFDF